MTLDDFISKWSGSGGAERANYQLFLSELTEALELPRPEPTRPLERDNTYVFEKSVRETYRDGSSSERRIDLYRKGSFVLEAKQGVDGGSAGTAGRVRRGHGVRGTAAFDAALEKARNQGEHYIKLLPPEEGRPPFLIVCDVGASLELFSEFSRTGGAYLPFPAPGENRIPLEALRDPLIQARLRAVWCDPLSLDPSLRAAQVTREVSVALARLSASLERRYPLERVSPFLMRLIFTLFAQNILLLPEGKVTALLTDVQGVPESFPDAFGELWRAMQTGGYSGVLRARVLHFNGGLFEDAEVLPLEHGELTALLELAVLDWSAVEPSIFGTLLERALSPLERHTLGAHYTPRAYVERLITPTLIEPLRGDWAVVQVEVLSLLEAGKDDSARKAVVGFLESLRSVRVLDPACGSANFLYVALERLKDLEAEVIEALIRLGGQSPLLEVDPHQFLGLEISPRAAGIAELVLWIGFLQVYARRHGRVAPPEPVLKAFRNIVARDAVLEHDGMVPNLNRDGTPLERWDGVTKRRDSASGREMPDPAALVQDFSPLNPRSSAWPEADFIVGNPPFLGASPMRFALGGGYVEALRGVYGPEGVPDSADFVMVWVHKALKLLEAGRIRAFGFVTTNSVKQTFNRRVFAPALEAGKVHLRYVVPDHPWVDAADGANVRIALSVFGPGPGEGTLERVVDEPLSGYGEYAVRTVRSSGTLHADFTLGANLTGAGPLGANRDLANRGVQLFGAGFIVEEEQARRWEAARPASSAVLRPYRNGRDLTSRPRGVRVIDLYGLSAQQALERHPEVYQHLLVQVKPERDVNARASYRTKWWLFGEPRRELRRTLEGLPRYIVTVETSKHRTFTFLDVEVLPDNMLVAIALEDAYFLGVLSSRIHGVWALAQGGRLGVGNDPRYNKTRCFDTFPFPEATLEGQGRIRDLAERLDAHRKGVLERSPNLTLTAIYNVLEKLRRGEEMSPLEREVHDAGLVSILRELHDGLDAAVLGAYGWSDAPSDEGILERLLALNLERVTEERAGMVRYLRPEFQARGAVQGELALGVPAAPLASSGRLRFPKGLREQVGAVRAVLEGADRPLLALEVAACFSGVKGEAVAELLSTLSDLGQVREQGGYYVR